MTEGVGLGLSEDRADRLRDVRAGRQRRPKGDLVQQRLEQVEIIVVDDEGDVRQGLARSSRKPRTGPTEPTAHNDDAWTPP